MRRLVKIANCHVATDSLNNLIQDSAPRGISLADLEDIPWPEASLEPQVGRPRKPENITLSMRCRHKASGKPYYRCIAEKCGWFHAGHPQRSRLLKHATACRKLGPDLRARANDWSSTASLGVRLGELVSDTEGLTPQSVTPPSEAAIIHSETMAKEMRKGKGGPKLKQGSLGEIVVSAGRKDLKERLDYRIMKLICIRNVPPRTVDSAEWKAVMQEANSKYEPTSSTHFVDSIIPAEAAQVRKLQIKVLKKMMDLTLTYDGGTTRNPQSVYTTHITTPDRRVFFIDGDEASREHHTAEHIEGVLLEV